MKKMKNIFLLFFLSLTVSVVAQNDIEGELGFVYMKAEYLLETQRYDEAMAQYGNVLRQDPSYKDAFVKQALCKYYLKSYRGVKEDVTQLIKSNGIDAISIKLLGLSDYHMGNFNAAVNSLITALTLEPNNKEILDALADSATRSRNTAACDLLSRKSGHQASSLYVSNICNGKQTSSGKGNKTDKPKTNRPTQNETPPSEPSVDSEVEPSVIEPEPEPEPKPKIDDTVNEIVVDEELKVLIQDGIGSRRVIDQPSILMLSNDAGQVAVKVCLSRAGRVQFAEIDASRTNMRSESLRSLALRKAQEFWFGRGEENEECGSIIFVINGG